MPAYWTYTICRAHSYYVMIDFVAYVLDASLDILKFVLETPYRHNHIESRNMEKQIVRKGERIVPYLRLVDLAPLWSDFKLPGRGSFC